jgi:hypothetical protein
MTLDAADLRAALAAELRENWDRITTIDAELVAALGGETLADVAELAAERSRRIEALFAAFPLTPENAALRASALRHLLSVNDSLGTAAREALTGAVEQATAARRQRKAISAYHQQDPEA